MYLEHQFEYAGNQLHYWQDKHNNKPALLLVHGALANADIWQPYIAKLSEFFSPIAVTLSHFLPSTAQGEFGLQSHAQQVNALLDHLAFEQVSIAAWSYGADVALLAALENSARIRQLFLYEPGCPACLEGDAQAAFLKDATEMFGPVFPEVEQGDILHAIEILIDGSANSIGYFSRQSKDVQDAQLIQASSLTGQMQQTQRPDMSAARLAQLQVPCHIALGENTRILFKVVCYELSKILPHASLQAVTNANHLLPLEDHERFLKVLLKGLSSTAL